MAPSTQEYMSKKLDTQQNFSSDLTIHFLNATVITDKTSIFVVFEGTTILSISETQPIQASGAF